MAGSLTLGGMADGTLSGNYDYGPLTVAGKRVISEVREVVLEANVDYSIKVPSEAVQWAAFFTFPGTGSGGEVKVGSNVASTTAAIGFPAQGFKSEPILSSTTELKFRAPSPPAAFNVVFV